MRDESQRVALPPLVGGILVGGGSRRMGRAKALLEWQGESFVERIAATLAAVVSGDRAARLGSRAAGEGRGSCRSSRTVPGAAGSARRPAGGVRRPAGAAWLVLTCDQPLLSPATLAWLIGERRAGRIAVLPRLTPGRIEPFPGHLRARLPSRRSRRSPAPERRGSLQPLAEHSPHMSSSFRRAARESFSAPTVQKSGSRRRAARGEHPRGVGRAPPRRRVPGEDPHRA